MCLARERRGRGTGAGVLRIYKMRTGCVMERKSVRGADDEIYGIRKLIDELNRKSIPRNQVWPNCGTYNLSGVVR